MWGEALSSPEYWAFAIAAFGEVVGLKPPKIADTVPKTILSDASLGRMVNLLKEASVKQGYYTFGTANAVEADIMGAAWVGPNFSVSQSSQGATIWISEDRLRQYRSPVRKNSNITQANFEKRDMPSGGWPHNGHLDVTP